MDKSTLKAMVDREIEPLMRRLGIPHWRVTVSYGLVEGSGLNRRFHGECNRSVDYNQAHITLDPETLDDEAHALKVLRHELYHVVLAPFDVYSNAVDAAVGTGTTTNILGSVWTHAVEQAAINLERMFLGLTGSEDKP
jgi:hypothetical protein